MELSEIFSTINTSYNSYFNLLGKTNVEDPLMRERETIIIHLFKIYLKEASNYPDLLIRKIDECLKAFSESLANSNGGDFSKYVCSAIKNLSSNIEQEEFFSETTKGIHISKHGLKLMKKVLEMDEFYETYGTKSEEKRNKKIALALDISVEKVIEMKRLSQMVCVSDEQESEGESFSLIDVYGKGPDYSDQNNQSRLEKLTTILDTIESEWVKKGDRELSEVLTVDIVKNFRGKDSDCSKMQKSDEEIENEKHVVHLASGIGINIEELLLKYSFIEKSIVTNFFSDPDYELPSQEELSAKFGYADKTGISQKKLRFYKKLRDDESLLEIKNS